MASRGEERLNVAKDETWPDHLAKWSHGDVFSRVGDFRSHGKGKGG